MKMKILDRVLLSIYTLAIIVISFLSLAVAWRVIPENDISIWINRTYREWQIGAIITIIGLLFLFVSMKLLFSGVKRNKPKSTLVKGTELGSIRISLNTLDGFAQKATRSFPEIRDVRSEIIASQDGIRIYLKIAVMPDVIIPELTAKLQKNVKEYIEKLSGIYIKDVQVYIDNPIQSLRSRVE